MLLLTTLAFKKYTNFKNNVFREISNLDSEISTINMKSMVADGKGSGGTLDSRLYCNPKEIVYDHDLQSEVEADYAVPDVICPMINKAQLHTFRTLNANPGKPLISQHKLITTMGPSTKSVPLNARYYASSDIYESSKK